MEMAQREYDVEIIYNIADEIEHDPTRVETLTEIAERVVLAIPPPIPAVAKEAGQAARLRRILDKYDLGVWASQIIKDMWGNK